MISKTNRYPEIVDIAKMAVNYRNFYVHGTWPKKLDKFGGEELEYFFTSTLEFIFATSDLIEVGWDIDFWLSNEPSHTHPFGLYSLNYDSNLCKFKASCKNVDTP